jgi:hypothetical protein
MKKENGSDTQLDLELFSSPIGKRFSKFHTENPHVYTELVALARQFKRKNPYSIIGIGMLYEVLRWNYWIQTNTDQPFKLSNCYRAFYSRMIMEREMDLEGIFNVKMSVADSENLFYV